jgi:hypothetical protein
VLAGGGGAGARRGGGPVRALVRVSDMQRAKVKDENVKGRVKELIAKGRAGGAAEDDVSEWSTIYYFQCKLRGGARPSLASYNDLREIKPVQVK